MRIKSDYESYIDMLAKAGINYRISHTPDKAIWMVTTKNYNVKIVFSFSGEDLHLLGIHHE